MQHLLCIIIFNALFPVVFLLCMSAEFITYLPVSFTAVFNLLQVQYAYISHCDFSLGLFVDC